MPSPDFKADFGISVLCFKDLNHCSLCGIPVMAEELSELLNTFHIYISFSVVN